MDLEALLPAVNASLNATSALCLLAGFVAIRKRRIRLHRACMLGSLSASTLFLCSYLTRVFMFGTHRFPEMGAIKTGYLILLAVHTVLAVVLLPMVARSLFLAQGARFMEHRRMSRITWPTWMFVSVSGVVVYFMLYHLAPHLVAQQNLSLLGR